VAFSMAWPQDAVQGGPDEEGARGMLAGYAASCTDAWESGAMRCSSWRTGCYASSTGCICWRSCRWGRSVAVAMARCMTPVLRPSRIEYTAAAFRAAC
jgi:hypothetical protein